MSSIRITLKDKTREKLNKIHSYARKTGNLRIAKRIMAIFAVCEGYSYWRIASILKVCDESIRLWVIAFLSKGPDGLKSKKSYGRPPKLTKSQKRELDELITKDPAEVGYPGACWRSPMIQHLIHQRFGIFYSEN